MNLTQIMHSRYNRCRGFGIVGWLFMIPVGIVALMILAVGFYEGRKAYWDHKIRELCEKDGGGKVLRTIDLNRQEYSHLLNKFGKLETPLDRSGADDALIVQKQTSTYIRRNDPEVRRDVTVVIRKSDSAILAESVIYSRVGGDLIALHPSYFSCPEELTDIYSAVVRQIGAKK